MDYFNKESEENRFPVNLAALERAELEAEAQRQYSKYMYYEAAERGYNHAAANFHRNKMYEVEKELKRRGVPAEAYAA